MIKCNEFNVNCDNSDAECFSNSEIDTVLKSKIILLSDPSICDRCVYNNKFSGYNYEQWETYKREVIVPQLREININKILE